MQVFERSTRIARRPDEVWAVLTDWERATEWMPGVASLAPVGAQDGAGTTLRFSSRGRAHDAVVRVWEPARRLVLESTQGGVTATYEYLLDTHGADGGATEMRMLASCETRGLPLRLLSPLLALVMRLTDGPQLRRFKATVERPAA